MKNTTKVFEESGYIQYIRKNAEDGHAWAQKAMGDIFYFGIGMEEELEKLNLGEKRDQKVAEIHQEAFEWYHNAAEQGDMSAMHAIGNLYLEGIGGTDDTDTATEALKCIEKAAKKGHADSLHQLAHMYENGWGVDADVSKARALYKEAVFEHSHKESIYPWARLSLNLDTSEDSENSEKNENPLTILYMLIVAKRVNVNPAASEYATAEEWAIKHHDVWNKVSPMNRKLAWDLGHKFARGNWDEAMRNSLVSGIARKTAIVDPPFDLLSAEIVFERTWRSVVSIFTNGEFSGSGVIVQPNIVATNWHVVRGAREIEIFQPKDPLGMKNIPYPVIGRPVRASNGEDYCLLHVPLLPGAGIPVAIRQYETLGIGETVYALGTPGYEVLSLSKGIISQLRDDPRDGPVIQMDADAAPGSSGGGLFDSAGNLIGHPTRGHPDSDEPGKWPTYAIAADIILEFDEDLRKANEEEYNGKDKE